MAKEFTGVVSSAKADKTIVVLVQTRKTHPIYHKQYLDSKKFIAHDEKNEAKEGDRLNCRDPSNQCQETFYTQPDYYPPEADKRGYCD